MSKIYVVGQSWAMGEWAGPRIVHGGLVQYLKEDGHNVNNEVIVPRQTHANILKLLTVQLTKNYEPGDTIIWVLGDSLVELIFPELDMFRLLKAETVNVMLEKKLDISTLAIKDSGGLKELIKSLQRDIFKNLNDIAVKYNVTVHCIGGPQNLNTEIIKEFTNLNPLLPSWINLIVGNFVEYGYTNNVDYATTYYFKAKNIDYTFFDNELATLVKTEMTELDNNARVYREEVFHSLETPGLGVHPNRIGHKVLFDYIKKELNL